MKEPRFVQDYLRDILEAMVKEDIPAVRPLLIGVLEKMHAEEG